MLARICLVIALAAVACAPAAGQIADETAVPRISVANLKKAVDAGEVLVIDVRDAGSYANGHISGAVNVPLEGLQQNLAMLKAAKKAIVAYCA